MNLLFVSNYFPPEVNAPATRLVEHARVWAAAGHTVEVLTSNPNFPEGEIYDGYENRFVQERTDGIDVTRVPMYVAENKGVLKRTLSYVSFALSALRHVGRLRRRPDLVVATSPQFFAAIGGYWIARRFGVPFVLEVRDLWPESIVAVGAVRRSPIIRVFERLEQFLYEQSDHIVVVTDAFKAAIVAKGIDPEKISVVKNGADLRRYPGPPTPEQRAAAKASFGLDGRFVAAYTGTIGMAHRADVLYEAAAHTASPDVLYVVVGTGAERAALEARQQAAPRAGFRLLDKQPKERMPDLLAACDVSVVHLRDSPLFRTVIPSKIFEAMAMGVPIVLGVRGETQEIVEASGAGLVVPPEDPGALAEAVERLRADPALHARMVAAGPAYVAATHDRTVLAERYWQILSEVFGDRLAASLD